MLLTPSHTEKHGSHPSGDVFPETAGSQATLSRMPTTMSSTLETLAHVTDEPLRPDKVQEPGTVGSQQKRCEAFDRASLKDHQKEEVGALEGSPSVAAGP